MPKFKIQPHAESLCRKCENAMIFQRKTGAVTFLCSTQHPNLPVPPDIVDCNEFRTPDQPSKYEMEKIAWMIKHDRSGKIVGFQPPKKDDK